MSNIKTAANGFTLVELLVTIAVIGITTGSLTSLFISIRNIQRQTNYVNLATRAAEREIESLRNDNYVSLTPNQSINFTSQLPAGLPNGSSGTVQVSQPAEDLRRVDVTVSYISNGKPHSIKLSSLIGVIGITQ